MLPSIDSLTWALIAIRIVTVFQYSFAAAPVQTATLKFKLSARNLIDRDRFGTTDGYVEVFYSHDGGKIIRKLGCTETIFDKINPDWTAEFEFKFDRKLKQYWFFHVYDEDNLDRDDTVGRVWVSVADFVDKNQVAHVNLDKGGYLTVKPAESDLQAKSKKGEAGVLPFIKGTPNTKTIHFKITVRGLPANVNNHEILIVTQADGVNGGERQLGKSSTFTASMNPSWYHVFTLNWSKPKDQRLHFKVYDATGENFKENDKVADAWIEVNDYIAKGESFTVLLPTKGTLTMTKV